MNWCFWGAQFFLWPLSGASAFMLPLILWPHDGELLFSFSWMKAASVFFSFWTPFRREVIREETTGNSPRVVIKTDFPDNEVSQTSSVLCVWLECGIGGFPCYLRWQCMCLCFSSSWLCKQHQRWRRGGAASRTARGPCTALWCHGRRCSWHGKGLQKRPPLQCRCRSSPSQTWWHTIRQFRNFILYPKK